MSKLRKTLVQQTLSAAGVNIERIIYQGDCLQHAYDELLANATNLRDLLKLLRDDICEESLSEGPYR